MRIDTLSFVLIALLLCAAVLAVAIFSP